jgi:predicted glycosyltransferase
MTASAHVLVFRPLIEILRGRGDEVEITSREYAQTQQLLELHGLESTVVGHHGGRSSVGRLGRSRHGSAACAGGRRGVRSTSPWRTARTS